MQGAFGRTGFETFPGPLTCVQLPPFSLSGRMGRHPIGNVLMCKVTPDPPDAKNASPNESPETQKRGEATKHDDDDRQASYANIRATPRTPCTMYIVNPEVDVQTLLGSVSESLASACVITMDLADRETGTSRNTLLGIFEIIMLAEISVNRALDQLDPIE